MEFDWDEHNLRKLNITNRTRGIGKEEIESVFLDKNPEITYNKYKGKELRYQIIGLSNQKRHLMVIFEIRNKKIRYVTGWQISSRENKNG
jgi:uncharacterized DUF497 family protein